MGMWTGLPASIALISMLGVSGCIASHERSDQPVSSHASPLVGGADPNGYIAQYECRKGNPTCDVDVAGLATLPCEVTITTSTAPTTDWSAVDWSKRVVCIEAGDHTGRGTLTVTESGTSGMLNVLRYTRSSDNNDEPWNQSNQAKIFALNMSGSYWIVHRLSFLPASTPNNIVRVLGANSIFDRNLVVGPHGTASGVVTDDSSDHVTIQNSVIYNGDPANPEVGNQPNGISAAGGSFIHLVNNELYDWEAHDIQVGRNENPTMPGYVVENNDLYETSAVVKPNGEANAKATLSLKATATGANPATAIHNRLWNSRKSDYDVVCCSPGTAINVVTPTDYLSVRNNIVTDSQSGLGWAYSPSTRNSVVGNTFYNTIPLTQNIGSLALEVGQVNSVELYFNSFIRGSAAYIGYALGASDIKCNAFLSLAVTQGGTPDAATQMDSNAFYDSDLVTYNGASTSDTNVSGSVSTRANATPYSVGAVMRTSTIDNCVNANDPACFVYRATAAGISAGSAPTPCTTLGCTHTDGGVTWQAIRGPYTFYRKLRTGGEQYVIPYAAIDRSAPEFAFCKTAPPGSRTGIGVNDDVAAFDGTGNGLLGTDLDGTPRVGTPGALEFALPKPKADAGADSGASRNDPDAGANANAGAPDGGIDGDSQLPAGPSADAPAGCSCRSARSSGGSPAAALAGTVFATVAARRWRWGPRAKRVVSTVQRRGGT